MSHYIDMTGSSGMFTCTLDRWYRLDGEWEVALVQVDIKKEWFINIEYRPKITNKPEYQQADILDAFDIGMQKIYNESDDHTIAEYQEALIDYVEKVADSLESYKYNIQMENVIKYITTKLELYMASLTVNKDNVIASFQQRVTYMYTVLADNMIIYETIKDGKALVAKPNRDIYYNNIKISQNRKGFLALPLLIKIDLINPDNELRSITTTQHDYSNLQYHKVTKNFFDSIRVEIQEPIKRTMRMENNPVYLRIHLRKVK
jgi:hypothetical protein